jgi:acyl-CoA thioesterase-1
MHGEDRPKDWTAAAPVKARTIAGAVALLLVACEGQGGVARTPRPDSGASGTSVAVPAPPASEPAIVFLGTSLTAGLGLDPDSAYPALIQRKLDSAGLEYRVVNAGVSGESSAGALRRMDWILRQPPAVLVIETGANDGLRGQDPDSIRANIHGMIARVREKSPATKIVLARMEAMPTLGATYVNRFRNIFPAVAQAEGVPLLPFILDGVAAIDSLNQQDGIHPNEAGARRVADNVWRGLRPLLADGR